MNMTETIAPKSDQINADDLIGGPRTITVTRVSANEGTPEQPVNVFFDGDGGKPFRPCKSMRRVMVAIWGADARNYVGRSMTLYRDPEVAFGGMKVGGIRISHMSHIDKAVTMALTATRASRKPYTVQPLRSQPRAADQTSAPTVPVAAHAAAQKGSDAFRAWWRASPDTVREAAKPFLDALQKTAAKADPDVAARAEDPFGLPPLPAGDTPTLTEEDAERIAAAARAETDRLAALEG